MKNIIIFFSLLFFSFSGYGQSIGSYVISNAGVSLTNNDASMYISIGEPMHTEISNGEIMIAQGFLQVSLIENTVGTDNLLNETINAYPNPTGSILNIEMPEMEGQYHMQIFDVSGRLIESNTINKRKENINFQSFEKGTYLLKVTKESKASRTLKIVKL